MQPTPPPGADIGNSGGYGKIHNVIVPVTQHHQQQMQHRHALPHHAQQQQQQHVPTVALSPSASSSSALSPAPPPIIAPFNSIYHGDNVVGSGGNSITETDIPVGATGRAGAESSSPPDESNSTASSSAVGGAKSGTRSRRGCWTCRNKKAKKRCDEEKPACGRCRRMNLVCDYTPRPSLAERRRQQALLTAQQQGAHEPVGHANSNDLQQSQAQHHHHYYYAQQQQYGQLLPHQQQSYYHHHGSSYSSITASHSPLAVVRLSSGEQAPCSLQLGSLEHESIHFFRTVFAKSQHTKNPDFSLFTIMFTIAQEDKMVMHMILSLGMRAMDLRRPTSVMAPEQRRTPLFHYSAALRSMAETVCRDDQAPNMDALLTALWLMCIYEQQFGDPQCQGYSNHLMGAASLVRHQHRSLRTLQPAIETEADEEPTALVKQSPGHHRMSLYSARILVWLALHDAAAATSGVGGHLNSTLYSILGDNDAEVDDYSYYDARTTSTRTGPQQYPPSDKLCHSPLPNRNHTDTFKDLYRYSNPLYRALWGEQYPQAELLDDVENRNIFGFLAHASQLRFLVAQLYDYFRTLGPESPEAQRRSMEFDAEIRRVGKDHAELLEVASGLADSTDNKSRLVKNIRTIVPLYYAAVLDFVGVVGLFSTAGPSLPASASPTGPSPASYGTTITGYPIVAATGIGFGPGGISEGGGGGSSRTGSSPTPSSPAASLDGKTKTPSMIAAQQTKQQILRAKRHAALRSRALGEILKLGYQTYTHGGDELALKIAWPLFMAALELGGSAAGSDEMAHRMWILERFAAFEAYGDNFARARRFLERFLREKDDGVQGLDFRRAMREHGEVFILGL